MVDFFIPPGRPPHIWIGDVSCLFFFSLLPDPPSREGEGRVNNAGRTLNVRAKNPQFPAIVSLAFMACFMHFIISAGVSAETRGGEVSLAVMGIAYFCEGWRFTK